MELETKFLERGGEKNDDNRRKNHIGVSFLIGALVGAVAMWAIVKSGAWNIKADESPAGNEEKLVIDTTPAFNDVQTGDQKTLRVEVKNPDQYTNVQDIVLYGQLGPQACYNKEVLFVAPLTEPPPIEDHNECVTISRLGDIEPLAKKEASVVVRCNKTTNGEYQKITFEAAKYGNQGYLASNKSEAKIKCI